MISQLGTAASLNAITTGSLALGFSVPFGSNKLLVVCEQVSSDINSTGVTFGGVSLTLAAALVSSSGDAKIWYLVNPPSVIDDVVVSYNVATSTSKTVWAIALAGVDQATPIGDTAFSGPASGTVASTIITTTTDGSWVIDSLWVNIPSSPTAGANQTPLGSFVGKGASFEVAAASAPEAITMSWSWSPSNAYRLVAVEIHAAAEVASTLLLLLNARGDN